MQDFEAGLMNIKVKFWQQSVTELMTMIFEFGHTQRCSSVLTFVQETSLIDRLVKQKRMLSSSFKYNQIYNNVRYEFGHTVVLLKSDLSSSSKV